MYSDNNQRIGHIKDKTPYVKYDVINTNMNTLQSFGFCVTVCIPKTFSTLFLKDSTQFLTFNGFSFVAGKYLQKLTIILRLNGCSFQIAGVKNLKYLDMTGWYCNAEMSDFSYFTLCLNYLFGYHAFRSQKNRFSHYYVILQYLFSPVIRYSEISVFTCITLF